MGVVASQPVAAERLQETLAELGVKPLARVWARDDALDIAFETRRGLAIVARCADAPDTADLAALANMLAEGPFGKAMLVNSSDAIAKANASILVCGAGALRETLIAIL